MKPILIIVLSAGMILAPALTAEAKPKPHHNSHSFVHQKPGYQLSGPCPRAHH